MSVSSDKPLTVPVLVGGGSDAGMLGGLFAIAGVVVAAGCIGAWQSGDTKGLLAALTLAAVFAVPAGLVLLWQWWRRRWLEVTVSGFILTRHGQRRVYADEAVSGLSLERSVTQEGKVCRRFVLEVGADEDGDRLDCTYEVLPPEGDPLAGFLDRLLAGLARRGRSALSGKGWRLDAEALHWRGAAVPRSALTRVGFFGGRLCVWQGRDERPFARVAADSRNAHVLGRVLAEEIAGRPPVPLPDLPLGRVLLDSRSPEWRAGLLVLSLFLPLVAVLAWVGWRHGSRLVGYYAAAFSPLALVGVLLVWRGWRGAVTFHEEGVSQRGRRLRYDEIAVMHWGPRRILFVPLGGPPRPTIRTTGTSCRPAADLEGLRDLVAGVVARRWAEELRWGPVRWTPLMRFLPGVLEYRPAGFFGPGEPLTAPYALVSCRVESNSLLLFVAGVDSPVARVPIGTGNLFPGVVLLDMLRPGGSGTDVPESAAEAARPTDDRFSDQRPSP